MSRLPTGTVTLLFTDIEGSTRLIQDLGESISHRVFADHRRLLVETAESAGGSLCQDQSESFVFAFPRAKDAVRAAVAAQRAFRDHAWPDGGQLRVRMGLHTGEPVGEPGEYVGLDVHRAARICGVGHGGQILLSLTTRELIADDVPDGITFRDLGEHRLKDLARPHRLFQIVTADLPADFPALKSLDALPNNLPIQLTSFIGREREKAEVKQLLSATRLLTLTGSGGAGKTRLALQVAAEAAETFAAGVWFVDLAPISDRALVPQTVASALSVPEQPRVPLTESVAIYLRSKSLLLLLDNCEHVSFACAELSDTLLRECPNLKILVISREALGIGGELTYRVPPLSLPKPEAIPQLEKLNQYDAVRLFVERASFSKPDFVLTNSNAPAVVQVCHRLDGIPLAIELAAVRMKVLAAEQIAGRLDDLFRLLTGGSRLALPRQQTLRAAMDWSHDLLADDERVLLRRLSVFAGGWSLEGAEAICSGKGVETADILDLLTQLVDKSLVVAEERGRESRYRLLETVRQYAWDRLARSKEAVEVRERHLSWYLALAEEADAKLHGPEQKQWLDRLETEYDNLRAALEWGTGETHTVEAGLRLSAALSYCWFMQGRLSEGRQWLERALASRTRGSSTAWAKALSGFGLLARRQGDYERARESLEESLVLFREMGDKWSAAFVLHHLAHIAEETDDYAKTVALFEESLIDFREVSDTWGVAGSLNCLGEAMQRRGHQSKAKPLLQESLTLCREVGDRWLSAYPIRALGIMAVYGGDYESATNLLEESLLIAREMGDKWNMAYSQNMLGNVALNGREYERAMTFFKESMALRRELGSRPGIAESLEAFGRIAGLQEQPQRAAQLFGAAERLREVVGVAVAPVDHADYDRNVQSTRDMLGEEAFETAWAKGRAMTLEQAVEYALKDDRGTADP